MPRSHILGFPRIGAKRELKKAVEAYWRGDLDRPGLLAEGADLRARHWALQHKAGLDFVAVGDFSWYDQMLDHSRMLGVVPARFGGRRDLDTYFRMGRGRAPGGADIAACEMTKWFDTNYHYLVPELEADCQFSLQADWLIDEVQEAIAQGYNPKPVVIGPLTYLWLAKATQGERLDRLGELLPLYLQLFEALADKGVEWVQVDEPALVQDLPEDWRQAFATAYADFARCTPKLLLATYFGGLGDNLSLVLDAPVAGLHLDRCRGEDDLDRVTAGLGERVLSVGIVNGRNLWRNDLGASFDELRPLHDLLGDRLWISSSCSLLHCPVDLDEEPELAPELRRRLAFATQKLDEIRQLVHACKAPDDAQVYKAFAESAAIQAEAEAARNPEVQGRAKAVTETDTHRTSPFAARRQAQRDLLELPLFPTTTIGSFPQTSNIRTARRDAKQGRISPEEYRERMQAEIREVIARQEALGLDVLVHGEPERNDMVEYFGELLEGMAVTANGWVQSYGSRCVKPPIIHGDVHRPRAMTLEWIRYAQSLSGKPVKGMLTGPVTILCWSFVREDLSRDEVCRQIALALRDEVGDLETAGVKVIQVDEPAFREGMPLRRDDWAHYLDWASTCFRLATSVAADGTQIHTHMCYSEFNDIIEAIGELDADVITIETARSQMELLDSFADFEYPNEIGPGVYDIHSPLVPSAEEMLKLMRLAAKRIPADRLWVNPDCGLKTRGWKETEAALERMVQVARELRSEFAPEAAG